MARQRATKPKINFIRGLLTESSPLASPENFFDEGDNIELEATGEVRRRFGLDGEESFSYSATIAESTFLTYETSEHIWSNVGNDADIEFRVVRIGATLYFFDNTADTLSTNAKSFTVSLSSFLASGYASAINIPISVDSGFGKLFIVGYGIEPFYISYNSTTDSITTTQITINIRDFEDLEDGYSITTEPTVSNSSFEYNMRNRGWVSPGGAIADPFAAYFTARTKYPSKNKQWWTAKDTSENFSADLLDRFYTGTTSAPKGRYILDAFNKNRTSISGVAGITTVTETSRPTSVAFYAGRIAWGFNSKIFMNRVIQSDDDIGICYQRNDPTSEDVPDLLDDDGAEIPILELSQVLEIKALGNNLIIYGSNGIWALNGTDGIFRATGYSVTKIADIRFNAKDSVVQAESIQVFWSETSIYALSSDSISQVPKIEDISLNTIDSFYKDISLYAKEKVIGRYDKLNKRITWLYTEYDSAPATVEDYTKQLTFDLKLQAFIPSSFPKLTGANKYPAIVSFAPVRNPIAVEDRYITYKYLVFVKDGSNVKYTFAYIKDNSFYDYISLDTNEVGVSYDSYIEPGHEQLGDLSTLKQAPYVQTFFTRTEENFVDDGDGNYIFDKPSSCNLVGKWDFATLSTSARWTRPQEVYRLLQNYVVDPLDLTFNYEYDVIVNKTKLRGKGRTLKTRFYSTPGKDFRLLGWNLIIDSNAST